MDDLTAAYRGTNADGETIRELAAGIADDTGLTGVQILQVSRDV